MNNQSIRKKIRLLRQNMPSEQGIIASSQIVDNIIQSRLFQKSKNIALFLPHDGEPDLSALITYCWAFGKNCYLPIVGRKFQSRLSFQQYRPDSKMNLNIYGISEPIQNIDARLRKTWLCDLVLMPLVAFDEYGNRIGMGKGYYDKTFQYRLFRHFWQKPRLMGIAFANQQVSTIHSSQWDVPMDFIVTNNGIKKF